MMSALQAQQTGAQAGNAAIAGMIPNASQPKGSPQLYSRAIDMLRKEVVNLGGIQAQLFRDAGTDDVMHKCITDIMGCAHKLQGCATTLESHLRDLAADNARPQPQTPQMQMGQGQGY